VKVSEPLQLFKSGGIIDRRTARLLLIL